MYLRLLGTSSRGENRRNQVDWQKSGLPQHPSNVVISDLLSSSPPPSPFDRHGATACPGAAGTVEKSVRSFLLHYESSCPPQSPLLSWLLLRFRDCYEIGYTEMASPPQDEVQSLLADVAHAVEKYSTSPDLNGYMSRVEVIAKAKKLTQAIISPEQLPNYHGLNVRSVHADVIEAGR